MDVQTPLLQPTHLPRSHAALISGAGMATLSLASVSLVARYWHDDGHLPYYAAEAACGAGLCVSLFQLQAVRDRRLRLTYAHSLPQPHFNLVVNQQAINQVAATMTGLGAVFGAAAVGLAAAGTALKLPTQANIAAAGVGLFNLGTAALHFYNQVHMVSAGPASAHPAAAPTAAPTAAPVVSPV